MNLFKGIHHFKGMYTIIFIFGFIFGVFVGRKSLYHSQDHEVSRRDWEYTCAYCLGITQRDNLVPVLLCNGDMSWGAAPAFHLKCYQQIFGKIDSMYEDSLRLLGSHPVVCIDLSKIKGKVNLKKLDECLLTDTFTGKIIGDL